MEKRLPLLENMPEIKMVKLLNSCRIIPRRGIYADIEGRKKRNQM